MAVRRFNKKRRTRKRRQSRAKPRTRVDKSLSRRISKLENSIETKYLDSGASGVVNTTGVTLSMLSGMAQGDDYNKRIGNEVCSKKVYIQYRLYHGPTDVPAQVRVMVYWDLQFNANALADLFTGSSPTAQTMSAAVLDDRAGMISVNAPYNHNTRYRYKMLYDVVHNINHGSDLVGTVLNVKRMINLHNAKIVYADTTADNDSVPSRMLLLSYFYTTATDAPTINFTTRFFFTDL